MKCPKCNFISFDYNDACPKCGKDLTDERDLMGLPSYKPKPLSLLAPLNAYNSEIMGDMTSNAPVRSAKEAMDDIPGELLISLDDLSEDESVQIQDDEPVQIQMESDPTQAEPEQKIDDEIILDLGLPDFEEAKSEEDNAWNPEAVEEIIADIEFDDVSEKEPELFVEEKAPDEAKGQESIFELELEPLEFDLDLEEPDKKTS